MAEEGTTTTTDTTGQTGQAAPTETAATDRGFPSDTPLEQMTAPQQVAYWKHQSRRHEGRAASAYGLLDKVGVTDETTALAVAEKAKAADKLADEKATDTERAAREAREAATTETAEAFRPLLVDTAFRMAIGDRKTAEEVDDFLADLNLSRFLTNDKSVDTGKVWARVNEFAPAKGEQQTGRKGPTATVHGSGSGTTSTTAASGRDLWEQQHGRRPGATTTAATS